MSGTAKPIAPETLVGLCLSILAIFIRWKRAGYFASNIGLRAVIGVMGMGPYRWRLGMMARIVSGVYAGAECVKRTHSAEITGPGLKALVGLQPGKD